MNRNEIGINRLRNLVYKSLDPIIDRDYCLLDVPDYRNIGDHLIWGGEVEYLKRLPHKMLFSANNYLYKGLEIPKDVIILLQGGGNFGDVWRNFQEFRLDVIKRYPENRIVIFPQTIHYNEEENILKDAEVLNAHPDLTICARDYRSFELANRYFHKCNNLLLPDMAFCMNLDSYIDNSVFDRVLILERVDQELQEGFNAESIEGLISPSKKVVIEDWPPYNVGRFREKIDGKLYMYNMWASEFFQKVPGVSKLINTNYGLRSSSTGTNYILEGIKFINQFDDIYTTRLHGFILAVLLNKEVKIIDNSYGKNSTFFDSWLTGFESVTLLGNREQ